MLFCILFSLICGLCLGFVYAFAFQLQIKIMHYKVLQKETGLYSEKDLKKHRIKSILNFAFLSLLTHLLLLILLAFLIIKFGINIPTVIISLMFSFWVTIIKSIK